MGDRRTRGDAERDERGSKRRTQRDAAHEPPTESHPLVGLQTQVGNRALAGLMEDEGRPLTPSERVPMEASFHHDFDGVRVHDGTAADEAASRLGAMAFVAGRDIYLGDTAPDTSTPAGKAMLAEELAHVVQGVGADGAERVLPADDALEADAHVAASRAAAGERASVAPAGPAASAAGRLLPGLAVPIIAAGIGYAGAWLLDEEEVVPETSEAPAEPATEEPVGITPQEYARASAAIPKLQAAKGMDHFAGDSAVPLLMDSWDILVSFADNPGCGHSFKLAGNDVATAIQMIKGISDEGATQASLRKWLGSAKATVESAVAGAKDEVPDAEGRKPEPTSLSTAQAAQLKAGAQGPIDRALAAAEAGDYQTASDALIGVSSVLNSFSDAPPALATALQKAARAIEGATELLSGRLAKTPEELVTLIDAQIDSAIGYVAALDPSNG